MHYKKVFHLVFILILLKGFSLEAIQSQIITWDKTEDYKLLHPNKTNVNATFTAYNNGTVPIRINRLETNSNALQTIIKGRIIPAKGFTEIEMLFYTENKKGIYNNKVAVYIDEDAKKIATLNLVVEIPEFISCIPNVIKWGDKNKNQLATCTITLDERFVVAIESLDYNESKYAVELEQGSTERNKYTLKIKPISLKMPFNSLIRIKAIGKKSEEIIKQIYLFNSFSL
tara:strand:+ start:113 stop:799 length:687 start_codon:yes stop_codon:yes gene_type:complete